MHDDFVNTMVQQPIYTAHTRSTALPVYETKHTSVDTNFKTEKHDAMT